jgi:hypothetical protein
LQSNWQAFRRTFAADPLGTTVDTNLFQQVFQVGRILHITHPRGYHFFTQVTSASVDSSGRTPLIGVSPPLPGVDECNFALCVGCQVTPIQMVEYGIDTAQNLLPALIPADEPVTGTNTILYRRELDPVTRAPLAGQTRAILEFAVHFDVGVIMDLNAPTGVPTLTALAPDTSLPVTSARHVRALTITLAGRTAETDPSFPVPYAGATRNTTTEALTSFPVFTDRPGSSRVRTAMAEIVLENLVLRGM